MKRAFHIDDFHRFLTEEQMGLGVPLTILRRGEKRVLHVVPQESKIA